MKTMAPGKLILSGEHAVVHGCPALVTAVSRHASVDVNPGTDSRIEFVTPFGEAAFTSAELRERRVDAEARYDEFLRGLRPIAEVVPTPLDFVVLAWPLLDEVPEGLRIRLDSEIPLGAGMGSSAAVSVALLQALAGIAGAPLDRERCMDLGMAMERFQHGDPSGVDTYVSVHGGMIRYQKTCEPVAVGTPSPSLQLVHTGTPEATTGECVEQVAQQWGGSTIWSEFAGTCADLERALATGDPEGLRDAIRDNHRLLVKIGVVPEPVAAWISDLERHGGAAKLCGAGSVRGVGGGIAWVLGELPAHSSYESFTVKGDPNGVRFVN